MPLILKVLLTPRSAIKTVIFEEPKSRIAKFLAPNQSGVMPDWDGLWVTFQSNEYRDVGQRSLMSVPRNTTSKSVGYYRKCMFRRGYLLRAM